MAVIDALISTAERSYYAVGSYKYRDVVPGATLGTRSFCDAAYRDCVADARAALETRNRLCSIGLLDPTQAQACLQSAAASFDATVGACQARLICSPEQCSQSPVAPYNYRCCAPGTQACGAGIPVCVPGCPPNKRIVLGDASCTCVCDPLLQECPLTSAGVQKVRDPNTCLCQCPQSCPATYVQDPDTCACLCLSPKTDCPPCVLLGTEANCSDCGDACGPFQRCCNGACVGINVDTRCGDCTTDCTILGRVCCKSFPGSSSFACVDTATDPANCGGCGQACGKDGRTCQGGMCSCPSGTTPCGSHGCCRPGETCCSYRDKDRSDDYCADLQTSRYNCGLCGTDCRYDDGTWAPTPTGDLGSCSNGRCRCPSGWTVSAVGSSGDHVQCCKNGRDVPAVWPDGNRGCCPIDQPLAVMNPDGSYGCCSMANPVPVIDPDGAPRCCPVGYPVAVLNTDGTHGCCPVTHPVGVIYADGVRGCCPSATPRPVLENGGYYCDT